MTGKTELTDANAVQNAGMSATRLAKAYRQAYRSYEPDRWRGEQGGARTRNRSAEAKGAVHPVRKRAGAFLE